MTSLLTRMDEDLNDQVNKIDMIGGHLFGDTWFDVRAKLANTLPDVCEEAIRLYAQNKDGAPEVVQICRAMVSELDEVVALGSITAQSVPPAAVPAAAPGAGEEFEEVEEEVPSDEFAEAAKEIVSIISKLTETASKKLIEFLVGTELAEGSNPENPSEGALKIVSVKLGESGVELGLSDNTAVKVGADGVVTNPQCLALLREFISESLIEMSECTTSASIPLVNTIPMKKVKIKKAKQKVKESEGDSKFFTLCQNLLPEGYKVVRKSPPTKYSRESVTVASDRNSAIEIIVSNDGDSVSISQFPVVKMRDLQDMIDDVTDLDVILKFALHVETEMGHDSTVI